MGDVSAMATATVAMIDKVIPTIDDNVAVTTHSLTFKARDTGDQGWTASGLTEYSLTVGNEIHNRTIRIQRR